MERVILIKKGLLIGRARILLCASILMIPVDAGAATYVTHTAINCISIYAGISTNDTYISIASAPANGTQGFPQTPATL